jgi:hypothetical protein
MAITDFLQTCKTKEELATALSVLKEFKSGKNNIEFAMTPFLAWSKLEQLEEFLEYLVNGKELAKDTLKYIKQLDETLQSETNKI